MYVGGESTPYEHSLSWVHLDPAFDRSILPLDRLQVGQPRQVAGAGRCVDAGRGAVVAGTQSWINALRECPRRLQGS
jgi:hypothetical protein